MFMCLVCGQVRQRREQMRQHIHRTHDVTRYVTTGGSLVSLCCIRVVDGQPVYTPAQKKLREQITKQ